MRTLKQLTSQLIRINPFPLLSVVKNLVIMDFYKADVNDQSLCLFLLNSITPVHQVISLNQ